MLRFVVIGLKIVAVTIVTLSICKRNIDTNSIIGEPVSLFEWYGSYNHTDIVQLSSTKSTELAMSLMVRYKHMMAWIVMECRGCKPC